MNILVLGNDGQLGRELARATWPTHWQLHTPPREEFNLADPTSLHALVDRYPFDLLINAAAYTAVDKAESEPELAHAVNAHGPGVLAQLSASRNTPIIHISTDYVFDGTKTSPYTEDDPTSPMSVYGSSKLAGELAVRQNNLAHIIIRTSWLYSPFGHNFIRTMIRLARERDEVSVVNDQIGCPTAAGDLATAIVQIAQAIQPYCTAAHTNSTDTQPPWGTYHYTGAGKATWYDLAHCIFETLEARGHRRPRLIPISTSQYPTPAARPAYSVMDCTKISSTFAVKPQPWPDACRAVVQECLAELQEVAK